MSLKDYFSKDEDKRSEFIFNLIAPFYSKMNHQLGINYTKIIRTLKTKINIDNTSVLDVGCGTGVWSAVFYNNGAKKVIGIDFAEEMLIESKKNYPYLNFTKGDAKNLYQFSDNSFDIVTASYVIHGVTQKHRWQMLSEMKRVAKNYIVIHDFKGNTPLFIQFLEFMERSDYKHFKKNICSELKELSENIESLEVNHGSGLYIVKVDD
jgi:ubiquinone/menaquinone biosynthesis C-methylase UbiE